MGNPYTQVVVTGYNPDPPSNDGQQTTANTVDWDKHKDELAGPVKTSVESTQSAITTAFDLRLLNNISIHTVDYTITTADRGKVISFNSAVAKTATLPPAADAAVGFESIVKNIGTADVTADGNLAETIDGQPTALVPPGGVMWLMCDGTNWVIASPASPVALPVNFIDGLLLSNNGTDAAHDIDIATGSAWMESVDAALTSILTKRIDATWALGTDAGGVDTGSAANDTFYYVWLIKRTDTGVVDALFSLSDTAPTLPTDYDKKRIIGGVETDASANIKADLFMQVRPSRRTYVSDDLTITSAAFHNLTHGLGGRPDRFNIELVNTTAEFNYTLGDVLVINPGYQAFSTNNAGVAAVMNAADIEIRIASNATAFDGFDFTSGAAANLTNASWNVRFLAERFT